MKPARLLPTVLLLATLAPAVSPQTNSRVRADMDFARKLATEFAYVDLAQDVVAGLEASNLSGEDAEALALLECDIYTAGARGEGNAEKRLELYAKAIEAYRQFIEEHEYSDLLPQAQRSYVALLNDYGRILEMRLKEQVGAEAEATRKQIKDALEPGLELTGDLIDDTEGATSKVELNERYRLMLNRGQMLLTIANVSEDGSYAYDRAAQTLENLALEAGETSSAGLNAYLLLARVKLAQGDPATASDFATYVYDVVLPTDPAVREAMDWDSLSFEEKVPRWKLGEVALDVVVQAFLQQGRVEDACRYALSYYNDWRAEGFDISPVGYLSMLSAARALLESGGWVGGQLNSGALQWFPTQEEMNAAGFAGTRRSRSALDMALSIAQYVNSENRGNTLQVRAQKVISEIIARPGVEVSPDILFEAAQGEYFAKNYAEALDAFRGIVSRLESRDEATQREYAPKVLYHIGKCLSYLGRDLEAAMAFREGATVWAGDPEYDQKLADGYYKSVARAKSGAGGDPLLENLYLEAENLLKALDAGGGAIAVRQAERAYSKKDYQGARDLYLQVEKGTDDYEIAVVKAALCLYKLKDEAGARREFENYLNVYVKDPRNKPVGAKKEKTRAEAMAVAVFYLGRMSYTHQEWDKVIEELRDFAKRFPEQNDYGPNALYMVVKAFIAKGDLDSAREVVDEMLEVFPTHSRTGYSALNYYLALKGTEDAAIKAGDEEALDALRQTMVTYLHHANEIETKPKYGDLRSESTLWLELGDWKAAEAVLRKLLGAFEKDSTLADKINQHILPDLGLALLEQKRIPEAFAVLDPLIPKDDSDTRKPSGKMMTRWCRSVTGWVEEKGSTFVEVPGVGGAENLELACKLLRKLTDSEGAREKYTCPWYHRKFDTAYGYYQWGLIDSERTKSARVSIEDLQNKLDDKRLQGVADACGEDTLRREFLWLLDKVR
ncbi:MAG TPA: hypothetical protein ENJ09_08780 [Planctomycetes bacterium]|nr:hypothetical protein [Planctomycetota bacterium]